MPRVQRKRTTRPSRERKVTRLTGTIEWNGDPGKILTAIIREGGEPVPHEHDIAIRCTYESPKTYEIGLKHLEGHFYCGSYSATLDKKMDRCRKLHRPACP